jgi:hypothetical protein
LVPHLHLESTKSNKQLEGLNLHRYIIFLLENEPLRFLLALSFFSLHMPRPTATLSPLLRADGSASYTCPSTGCRIICSVNGPIELPGRRDAQKPEEATLDVLVKPGTAQAGVGEKYAEGILKGLLSRLVLGREKGFSRRGIVITLVVSGGENGGKVRRGESVSLLSYEMV